jgi:hypothetical protein
MKIKSIIVTALALASASGLLLADSFRVHYSAALEFCFRLAAKRLRDWCGCA